MVNIHHTHISSYEFHIFTIDYRMMFVKKAFRIFQVFCQPFRNITAIPYFLKHGNIVKLVGIPTVSSEIMENLCVRKIIHKPVRQLTIPYAVEFCYRITTFFVCLG